MVAIPFTASGVKNANQTRMVQFANCLPSRALSFAACDIRRRIDQFDGSLVGVTASDIPSNSFHSREKHRAMI